MILSVFLLVGLLAAPATSSALKGGAQERIEEQRASGVKGDLGRHLQPVEHSQRTQQHYEQRVQVAYAAKGQPEAITNEQAKLTDLDLYQQREEARSDRQQFYEAQPQLREPADSKQDSSRRSGTQAHATKSGERFEEQAKFEDYPQQREESPAQPAKGSDKQDYRPETTRTHQEVKQQQVREEILAPNPAKPTRIDQVAASKSEERHEEQVQYTAQAPEEEQPRYEAQRQLDQAELQQQQVDLARDYEQRRYDVQTEVRQEVEQRQAVSGPLREEQLVKGGLRAPGAEAEPYAFDYSVEGSSRRESGDQNGVVRGQYTLQNPDGTQRVVDYVADQDGFRAQVRTNEFGTEGHQQQLQQAAIRTAPVLEGKTYQQQQQRQQEVARVSIVAASAAVKSADRPKQLVYQEEKSTSSASKVEAAAKGAAELRQAVVQEPEAQVQRAAPAVDTIKSAELRSPKAIGVRAGPVVTRASGFESATSHHEHQPPVVHSHPVPVAVPVVAIRHQPGPTVPVVRHQILTPSRSHHQHVGYQHNFRQYHTQPVLVHGGVSRSQLQQDRYPPASYRRDQLANPHVSFYSNHHQYNHDDEQPVGFEHPADLI